MAEEPVNSKYGLTPKEARMIGLNENSDQAVNKDVELEAAVMRRVRSMGANNVHVRVQSGKVTLSGMCDDFSMKRDIVQTIKSMPGVFKVINQIKVIPSEGGQGGRGIHL